MYSPKITEPLIPRLYRLAKARRRPMTKIVAEALEQFLEEQEAMALDPDPIQEDDTFVVTDRGRQLLRRARPTDRAAA